MEVWRDNTLAIDLIYMDDGVCYFAIALNNVVVWESCHFRDNAEALTHLLTGKLVWKYVL